MWTLDPRPDGAPAQCGIALANSAFYNQRDRKEMNMTTQSTTMQTDPVCGMQVEPSRTAGSSQHAGNTYHFCSPGYKTKFDNDPNKFANSERSKGSASGGCCG